MKKIFMVILVIVSTKLFSQVDKHLANFYPIQTGNYWQYEEKTERLNWPIQIKHFSFQILGDTLLSNGKKYAIFLKKSIPDTVPHQFFYDRIDSTTLNIYRYNLNYYFDGSDEFLIDSLNASVGDYSGKKHLCRITNTPCLGKFVNISSDSILGFWTNLRRNVSVTIFLDFHYWLAENVGLVKAVAEDIGYQYSWKLIYALVNGKEFGVRTNINSDLQNITKSFKLFQNYPNPFNMNTIIKFYLPESGMIRLKIFDILGHEIATLINEKHQAGEYAISWTPSELPCGLYLCQLQTENFVEIKKLILLK